MGTAPELNRRGVGSVIPGIGPLGMAALLILQILEERGIDGDGEVVGLVRTYGDEAGTHRPAVEVAL